MLVVFIGRNCLVVNDVFGVWPVRMMLVNFVWFVCDIFECVFYCYLWFVIVVVCFLWLWDFGIIVWIEDVDGDGLMVMLWYVEVGCI